MSRRFVPPLRLPPGFSRPRIAWALLGSVLVFAQPVALAVPTDGISTPQPTRVEHFNPDVQVCKPEAIRAGFAAQLQPWADESPAVQARLREVQLDMMRSTLRRCVTKGLMDRAQAEQLFSQLIGQGSGAQTPAAGTPPAGAPAPRTP